MSAEAAEHHPKLAGKVHRQQGTCTLRKLQDVEVMFNNCDNKRLVSLLPTSPESRMKALISALDRRIMSKSSWPACLLTKTAVQKSCACAFPNGRMGHFPRCPG
eukprot:1161585-Pelagomonas_calceolata.AAC.28